MHRTYNLINKLPCGLIFFLNNYIKAEILGFASFSTLSHTIAILMTLRKKPFENNVGKGKNAGNQHFLLFPQCFLLFPKQISGFFFVIFILSSANTFNLDQSKILLFCKELNRLKIAI